MGRKRLTDTGYKFVYNYVSQGKQLFRIQISRDSLFINKIFPQGTTAKDVAKEVDRIFIKQGLDPPNNLFKRACG